MQVRIDEIKIGINRRSISQETVAELKDSIKEIGLINPITVTKDYILIAGNHRLEALKQLGHTEVEATVVDVTGLQAELAEIDENLIRNELHFIERGEQLQRRKEIYEQLHPETKHGANNKSNNYGANQENGIIPFSKDASNKLNVSKSTVEKEIKIAKDLLPEVKEVVKEAELPKIDALKLTRFEPEKQKQVIEQIKAGKANNVDTAVKEIKKAERAEDIARQKQAIEQGVVEVPQGVFDVIVIDPPWSYGREYDPNGSRIANPYPEMTQQELLELNIPSADDSVMFLWTTHQFIWDAKELLDHWGYNYKATLVWDKDKIGMGSWLRMQCEFCLVGIKGKPYWNNTTWRDIIREPRREHSRKPEIFYQLVEQVTAGRRLDFFSREQRNGWVSYGNDTTKF